MDEVIITKKLAEDLFRFLGRQPCASVFGLYAELAAAMSKCHDQPAPADTSADKSGADKPGKEK